VTIGAIPKEQIGQTKEIMKEEFMKAGVNTGNLKEVGIGIVFKCSIICAPNRTLFLLTFFDSISFCAVAYCSPLPLVRGTS
jgi:hypothetical protein